MFNAKYDLLLCERLADTSQFGGFGDMRDDGLSNSALEKQTTSTPIGANVNNISD